MNGYLLDTHVLLWWLLDPELLSEHARKAIADGSNPVHVSAAAVWEMSIKKSLGRLEMPGNLIEVLRKDNIEPLSITVAHALAVADLPLYHHDPFDRMQIVQARLDNLTLITRDARIQRYDVRCLQG